MSAQRDVSQLEQKLQALKQSVLGLRPAIQGSILKRTIRRPDPARPGKTKAYGPYYQWTRKVAGRTAIQNLTAAQARVYARAIRENRKLDRIVADMRTISLRLLELTTPGVVRRHRRTKAKKALS
ncbi:MAG: hypothetical protein JW889_06140 [Verrucomicrobia bacterium]|nr:hypothetical protein [Verrucomicrobiota bacterium]